MVTKPLKEFVDTKVKGYVHWDVEEWTFIREQAKVLNIPTHWVIKDMRNFLTSSKALQQEFEKYLGEKYQKRAFALKPAAKWFACDQCSKGYLMEATLESHKKMAHPLVAPVIRGR